MYNKKPITIAIIYFSGTHVTFSYAKVIRERLVSLGCEVKLVNVTPHAARLEPFPTNDFDAFIFGFPVYADFAPSVIHEWLPTLDGDGKRCGMFFTYGGQNNGLRPFPHEKPIG